MTDMFVQYGHPVEAPVRFLSTVQFKARVVDWNGDGLPDLVDADSAFGPTELFVYLNHGTKQRPAFVPDRPDVYPITRGSGYGERQRDALGRDNYEHYYGFEVVDWNGDGLPDFLAGGLILHLNVGTRERPRFENRGPILIGGKPFPFSSKYTTAVFADLDGDGRRDLLISTHTHAPSQDGTNVSWSPENRKLYQDSTRPDWDPSRSPWAVPRLFICRNVGEDHAPRFDTFEELLIEGESAHEFVHGWAMLDVIDWRGDGFGDLIVGDSSRCIRYFRNLRRGDGPAFEVAKLPLAEGVQRLQPDHIPSGHARVDHPVCTVPKHVNETISLELPVSWLCPNAVDWDGDGDLDLVVTANDHSLWFIENVGTNERPCFAAPRQWMLSPEASATTPIAVDNVPVPQVVDWDGDGRPDIIVGGEQGRIHLFRNVGRAGAWRFAAPEPLRQQDGKELWLADAHDGYFHGIWCPGAPITTADFFGYVGPTVVDLDGDGDLDILCSDISLHLRVIENVGTRTDPVLRPPYPIKLADGRLYEGAWRCRPGAYDIDGDGLVEVIHPDITGVYHLYRVAPKRGKLILTDDTVLHDDAGQPLRLRDEGQRLHARIVDWDGDGRYDVLVGYINGRVLLLRNVGDNRKPCFSVMDLLPWDQSLHDCGADAYDWYGSGRLDLIQATECGYLRVINRSVIDGDDQDAHVQVKDRRVISSHV